MFFKGRRVAIAEYDIEVLESFTGGKRPPRYWVDYFSKKRSLIGSKLFDNQTAWLAHISKLKDSGITVTKPTIKTCRWTGEEIKNDPEYR